MVRAGIWRISETDEALIALSGISGADADKCRSWKSPARRRQWLASRALLVHLTDGKAGTIVYNAHGKPFTEGSKFYISISHTNSYAAVAVSEDSPVGVDIEQIHPRVRRVAERFLNQEEQTCLGEGPSLIALYYYWSAKEAAYKISGRPSIDFRNNIIVHPIDYLCNINGIGSVTVIQNASEIQYALNTTTWDDQMLVVCYSP
jgi:phosphopantetheinyl transferase